MTDDELIEVMARAICIGAVEAPDAISKATGKPKWVHWRPSARAALTALREAGYEVRRTTE